MTLFEIYEKSQEQSFKKDLTEPKVNKFHLVKEFNSGERSLSKIDAYSKESRDDIKEKEEKKPTKSKHIQEFFKEYFSFDGESKKILSQKNTILEKKKTEFIKDKKSSIRFLTKTIDNEIPTEDIFGNKLQGPKSHQLSKNFNMTSAKIPTLQKKSDQNLKSKMSLLLQMKLTKRKSLSFLKIGSNFPIKTQSYDLKWKEEPQEFPSYAYKTKKPITGSSKKNLNKILSFRSDQRNLESVGSSLKDNLLTSPDVPRKNSFTVKTLTEKYHNILQRKSSFKSMASPKKVINK